MIYEQVREDLKESMKAKNTVRTDALRMILGEVGRLNKKMGEKITDSEIIKIINFLIKSETLVLEYSGVENYKSPYIDVLKSYLPTNVDDAEIVCWIKENIDFSKYSDKIQAMKDIMPVFKPFGVNGNKVKQIIMGM